MNSGKSHKSVCNFSINVRKAKRVKKGHKWAQIHPDHIVTRNYALMSLNGPNCVKISLEKFLSSFQGLNGQNFDKAQQEDTKKF